MCSISPVWVTVHSVSCMCNREHIFPRVVRGRIKLNRLGFGCLRTSMLILMTALAVLCAAGQVPEAGPEEFFEKQLEFTRDQVRQACQGEIVSRTLKPSKHDVATAVVGRVAASEEFFINRFRDIQRHKTSKAVPLVRKFSDPPRLEDLRDLVLLPQEVRDLKKCRPGQCNLKLSGHQIELLRQQVDWGAPDAAEQANAAFRRILLEYVQAYLAAGNKAMLAYDDKREVVQMSDQFTQLVEASAFLAEYTPEFREYLLSYPGQTPPNVENFLYWSREGYGSDLKPVLSITHVTIYRNSGGPGPAALIASKQLYASHYFEASLGLTMLFPLRSADAVPGFYLVYLNRSRIDLLRKWYSGLARGSVSESVRDSMKASMTSMRSKVENEYRQAQPPP